MRCTYIDGATREKIDPRRLPQLANLETEVLIVSGLVPHGANRVTPPSPFAG
jgi:hypothetical protein